MPSTNHFLNYLDLVAPPERKLLFENALEALQSAGIDDAQFLIDQMMESSRYGSSDDFLAEVHELLRGTIHSLLIRFGIGVEPDTELAISTDMLVGVLALDKWDDNETLAATCESSDDPAEVLSSLLGIVTTRHEDEYLRVLVHVNGALIDRVEEVNSKTYQDLLPTDAERSLALRRLDLFAQTHQAPIAQGALHDRLLVGGDYHATVEIYHHELAELEVDQAIMEFTAFALVSNLPTASLGDAIAAQLNGWWTPQTASHIANQARALVKELKLP